MMNLIENSNFGMGSGEFGADIAITPQENFVNGVYMAVDEATACGLDRLRSEDGIVPTCKLGCCHCCRYHILMNIAEAHTLAQYIAYPVRPIVCRTHFVCSHPISCIAVNDPESTEAAPVVLTSIVTAAGPFSKAIKEHIENAGLDFSRSQMLLPHWLAIEMGWAFAISL